MKRGTKISHYCDTVAGASTNGGARSLDSQPGLSARAMTQSAGEWFRRRQGMRCGSGMVRRDGLSGPGVPVAVGTRQQQPPSGVVPEAGVGG